MAGGLLCSSLTMAAEKADWDKVLEQAKQEGNVTFSCLVPAITVANFRAGI